MGREDLKQRVSIMIFGTLAVDLAGCRIQKGEQIGGAIASIVKVLNSRLISGWGQGGSETFERLDACTLVETVQVLRWMGIVFNDMFHLWEKIRIGNLQIVFSAMGTQCMVQEDPMDGCTTDWAANGLRVLFEIPLYVTQ